MEESNNKGTRINRVFIVGNGFDLDCGLDTTYDTFCKTHFCDSNTADYTSSKMYKFLKEKFVIATEGKNWFSLEDEMRNYIIQHNSEFQSSFKSDRCYFNELIKAIRIHIQIFAQTTKCMERTEYVRANADNTDLFKNPVQIHIRKDSVAYEVLKSIVRNPLYFTQIISFNYTNIQNVLNCVVGEIVGFNESQLNKRKDLLPHVQYIHCNFDSNCAVLGIEQRIFANDGQEVVIPQSYNFLKKCNQFSPSERQRAIDTVMTADELVIFGHSLGQADADYFKPLFEDMFANKPSHERKITFITYNDNREILKHVKYYAGGNNIVPHHSFKDLSFIYTSVEESRITYSNLLNGMS